MNYKPCTEEICSVLLHGIRHTKFMKSLLILTFAISIAYGKADTRGSNKFQKNDSNAIQLFTEIGELIAEKKENHVASTYDVIKKQYDEGDLRFLTADDSSRKNIGSCAEYLPPFYPDSSNKKASIILDVFIFDLMEKHASLAYAILVHEMRHAFDYMKNPDRFTVTYTGNKLEGYLYEMDAYYLEGLFLAEYIDTNVYRLTKYEKYLLMSLKSDNLQSFSIAFKGIDNALTRQLYELSENSLTAQESRARFVEIGKTLIKEFKFPDDADEWARFNAIVPLYTFCQFGPQIVRNILQMKDNKFDFTNKDFSISDFKDENQILLEASKLMKPHIKEMSFVNMMIDKANKEL